MSVSIDTRQIEKLTQLQATLELLQNPESYTTLLADVKDVLQRYEVASKRYNTTEAADKFLQESQRLLAESKQEASKVRGELDKERQALEQKQRETTEFVNKQNQEILTKQGTLAAWEHTLAGKEVKLQIDKEAFEGEIKATHARLDKIGVELAAREITLRTKEEALKKLLG